MSSKVSKRREVLLVTLAGLALLCTGAVVLWRMMPPVEVKGAAPENSWSYIAPRDLPSVLPAASLEGVRVAVLEEPENVQLTAEGYYAGELERWRTWLRQAEAQLVSPAEAEVLIVPHGECLGTASRSAIRRHLQGGGGIVSSGLLGARDGQCRPLSDTLLVNFLGRAEGASPVAVPDEPSPHAVVLGETMLGANLPPGARFEMGPMHPLVFRDSGRAVFFSDYHRQPVRKGGMDFFDAAVSRARVADGRVVAFGFGLTEVAEGWSEEVVRRVVANAVTWASGRPVVHLAPWPNGAKAAAVVAQDVETDYANASGAVEIIEKVGIPTTYFLVGTLAESNPWVTRKLVSSGEIGSHSYRHLPMDLFSDSEQRQELAHAKRATEELSGRPVLGFRPPEERFTEETLRYWAELGGDYVFAANNSRAAAPEIIPFGPDSLVLLARVVDDDFEILNSSGIRDRGQMIRNMVGNLEEVIDLRGLYMFSYHSHMFAQEALLPVVEALATALRDRPEVWTAQAGDVARWWRTRAAVTVDRIPDGSGVRLRNRGEEAFQGGVLLVDLPDGTQRRIRVPDLAPGDSLQLLL